MNKENPRKRLADLSAELQLNILASTGKFVIDLDDVNSFNVAIASLRQQLVQSQVQCQMLTCTVDALMTLLDKTESESILETAVGKLEAINNAYIEAVKENKKKAREPKIIVPQDASGGGIIGG